MCAYGYEQQIAHLEATKIIKVLIMDAQCDSISFMKFLSVCFTNL